MTWAAAALVELAAPRLRSCLLIDGHGQHYGRLAAVIFAAGVGRCRDEHAVPDTIKAMQPPEIDRWRLILPVKGRLTAKSRLHPPDGVARADLAHAFALDTIAAAVAVVPPTHLVVVTSDQPTATFVRAQGAVVVADVGEGLNPAIVQGVRHVIQVLGPGPTAILLGDIPTLRPQHLIAALAACGMHSRAMVPDASGTGTVLLSALRPRELHPRFGPSSAREHGVESVRLDLDLPALRTDVDDDQALRRAIAIGVGKYTADVLHLALD